MMGSTRCTEIQQAVSSAFDATTPDPDVLETAKAHCKSCPECARFVGFLTQVERLPAPAIPADVLERTLAAVRSEAANSGPEEERSTAHVSADVPGAPAEREAGPATSAPIRPQWRSWAPWAAAAAVFFVAAGVVTTQGVRYLLSPRQASTSESISVPADLSERGATGSPAAPGSQTDDSVLESDADWASVTGPAYVTLSNRVYTYDSALDAPPIGAPSGTLTSALTAGGTAEQRDVFPEPGSDAIIVAAGEDSYLRLVPVTRSFRGRPYTMRASLIPAFGVWPSLPEGIPRPSTPDGTPEFVPAGNDDSGVQVFARTGTDPASGFGIAPGTAPSDPAAGNPDWTWWEPADR